ncbi:hypothetical protein, partial [Dactylosporangium roseum]
WGNNWVIAAIVVTLPFHDRQADRPVSLPVAFALWTKGGPTKQILTCRLITTIAAAADRPDRRQFSVGAALRPVGLVETA